VPRKNFILKSVPRDFFSSLNVPWTKKVWEPLNYTLLFLKITPYGNSHESIWDYESVQNFFINTVTSIAVTAFVANFLVIYLILKCKATPKSLKMSLTTIAFINILMASTWRFSYCDKIFDFREFRAISCKIFSYVPSIGEILDPLIFFYFFTTSMIHREMRLSTIFKIIFLSIIIALPSGYFGTSFHVQAFAQRSCFEFWPKTDLMIFYRILCFSIELFTHFSCIVVCATGLSFTNTIRLIQMLPVLLIILIIFWFPMFFWRVSTSFNEFWE
jgi:hypothetical protein